MVGGCWLAFSQVILTYHPSHSIEKLKYLAIIVRNQQNFPTADVWLQYDKSFHWKAGPLQILKSITNLMPAATSFSLVHPIGPRSPFQSPLSHITARPRDTLLAQRYVALGTWATVPPVSLYAAFAKSSSCVRVPYILNTFPEKPI